MSPKLKTTLYWTTTILVAFSLLSGGITELLHQKDAAEGMAHLGYPPYLNNILGVWKILGTFAILAPGLPRLKEWAYAGTFFDYTGAFCSHLATHDPIFHLVVTAIATAILITSWSLRPPTRVLGTLCPAKDPE